MLKKVKSKLKDAIREKNEPMKMACRMILGEVPRLNKKADEEVTDSEIINITTKLQKSEMLVLDHSGQSTSDYLEALECFIPEKVSNDEIREFISSIDFSKLKSPMQAIGLVKKEFGSDKVDGNIVKQIIENLTK